MERTQKKLKDKMYQIFDDFVKQEDKWDELNLNLNTESYTFIHNQQYYLLKYFPAYFTEYFHIWNNFLNDYTKSSINIVSIGCGVGIDFDAFSEVLRISKIDLEFEYYGFDIIDWEYRTLGCRIIDIDNINEKKFRDIDVIFLPKILTELNEQQLENLANKIINSHNLNEIYFINSYITDDVFKRDEVGGIDKFQIICEKLKYNGYKLVYTECETFKAISDKEHGLVKEYDFFIYPDEIQSTFKLLVDVNPILNNKYIAYNILKFVKNDN
jgi:hypothetical protein